MASELFVSLPAPEGGVAGLRRKLAARAQRRQRRRRIAFGLAPVLGAAVVALSLRGSTTPAADPDASVALESALDPSLHPMLALAAGHRFVGASLLAGDPQRVWTAVPTRDTAITLYLHDTR